MGQKLLNQKELFFFSSHFSFSHAQAVLPLGVFLRLIRAESVLVDENGFVLQLVLYNQPILQKTFLSFSDWVPVYFNLFLNISLPAGRQVRPLKVLHFLI